MGDIINKKSIRLLVTGGAGFIGSNFIRYWLKEYPDDKIVNLDILNYAGNLENLKDAENNPNYKFVKGDICDMGTVAEIMGEVDLIVHFAAESHVDRSIMDSGNFVRVNVEGTRVLLEAAKNAGGKRFHHISTDEVFGHLGPGDPAFSERAPLSPRSPYSASKAGAEHLVRAYFYTHKLPITISNCSNNYGPYHFPEKVIPLFITNLMEGKKVPLYGDGKNVRDWIHVLDHCSAIDVIIHKGKIGHTYVVGGNSEKSNFELTMAILENMGMGEEMIDYVKDRPGHDRRYAIRPHKIKAELGWQPTIGFDDGIRRTIQWYAEHEAWWQGVKTGDYLKYYDTWY